MSTIIIQGTAAKAETWGMNLKSSAFLKALVDGMERGRRESDVWMIGGKSVQDWGDALRPHSTVFPQIDGHFYWGGAADDTVRTLSGEALSRYLQALATISPN